MRPRTVALIGPGRAGTTMAAALIDAGWVLGGVAGRTPDSESALAVASRFDVVVGTASEIVVDAALVLIATPDREIERVASEIAEAVAPSALVVHCSGARALEVLDVVVARIGAIHPLLTMPGGDTGHDPLSGVWCATAGDPEVETIARELGMIPFSVLDSERGSYHAAACIASNHLVALLAQVEACTHVPLEVFLPLVRTTVENVAARGPVGALTGPVARGDLDTVRSHIAAIPDAERPAYVALARRAAVLAGRDPDAGGVLA